MIHFNDTTAKLIGDELGVDWNEVDLEEFNRGLNFELDHGFSFNDNELIHEDLSLIAKIIWSHLKEVPDYYTQLLKIERNTEAF
jgi:hypothetical protein